MRQAPAAASELLPCSEQRTVVDLNTCSVKSKRDSVFSCCRVAVKINQFLLTQANSNYSLRFAGAGMSDGSQCGRCKNVCHEQRIRSKLNDRTLIVLDAESNSTSLLCSANLVSFVLCLLHAQHTRDHHRPFSMSIALYLSLFLNSVDEYGANSDAQM